MSVRRLLLTAAAMAAVAVALTALAPGLPAMVEALAHPQRTVDQAGADAVVLAGAGLLAWLCWGWGALGLTLTAASALPGLFGGVARLALQVVLPAGARRSATALLGLGLGVAGPLAGVALPSTPTASAAVGSGTVDPVPDWPSTAAPDWPAFNSATGDTVPDWPTADVPDRPPSPATGSHVVVRGDCLWSIAETRLLEEEGRTPSSGAVAAAVHAWWTANSAVIGLDPDRLLPGQVLLPPAPR